ncbi:MAG: zf-HC2 domain-containing protein [Acidimicrobiales bacterium]
MLSGMRDNVRALRTCHETGRWLQHFLDGELDVQSSEAVEDHLRTCVRCGMEFDTYARIKEALHETSRQSPFKIDDEVANERLRRFANELVGSHGGARN